MEFINIALLGGLGAASIPFIIYLFNRSRFKTERWGAMHLLDSAMAVNRRRVRIEQLLLIILRAVIPGILAICMARPVITQMRSLIRDAKTSMVVLLDNSFSMDSQDNVESNFSRGNKVAARIVQSLPRGSQAAVVGMAGPVSGAPSSGYDLNQSRIVLEDAWGSYGIADTQKSIEEAAGLHASEMHHADRQLLIISDFQRVSWGKETGAKRRLALEQLRTTSIPPRIVLFDVGREVDNNVAVESITMSRSVVGVNQKVKIHASLRNHGSVLLNDLRVYFRVDGTGRSVSQISLGPGESTQVLFSHSFETAGSHIVEVSTEGDALKADNSCRFSVPVLDTLPVLIVDGEPSPEPLQAESSFLELALSPYSAAGSELKDMIDVSVVPQSEFSAESLTDQRVVVFANISSLDAELLKAVEEFVSGGGGLLVLPGDKADLAWYRNKAAQAGGLLPMTPAAIAGNAEESRGATIVAERYEHEALKLFNDPRNGSLSGARIQFWYRLQPASTEKTEDDARRVIARLDNEDPFLVEKDFGHGRVIMSCVPGDADWSNLPLRPFFLPLMQQLVTFCASKVYPPRNIGIGETLAAFLPQEDAGKTATLTSPNGTRLELPISKRGIHGVVEYNDTRMPGAYLLETPAGEVIHYVVNTPVEESNIELLDRDELQELASEMNATVVTTYEEYRDLEKKRRYGQEIWVLLLWLAVIAIFGELFLTQFFSRAKQ